MSKTQVSELLFLSVRERIRLAQTLWDSIAAVPDSIPLTYRESGVSCAVGEPAAGTPVQVGSITSKMNGWIALSNEGKLGEMGAFHK